MLSEENEVFFQASFVASTSLVATFTLPTAGEYTTGVFRTSLVEPDLMQSAALRQQYTVPTVFQSQGSLSAAE